MGTAHGGLPQENAYEVILATQWIRPRRCLLRHPERQALRLHRQRRFMDDDPGLAPRDKLRPGILIG